MTVVYYLWLREVKRYLRSRPQIIGSIAQPLLYLLVLGFAIAISTDGSGSSTGWSIYVAETLDLWEHPGCPPPASPWVDASLGLEIDRSLAGAPHPRFGMPSALAPAPQHLAVPQDPEVVGDPRLAHSEHLGDLSHGELSVVERGEDPQSGGIGEEAEDPLHPGSISAFHDM